MAKVTYSPDEDQIADNDLPKTSKQFGYDFTVGKAVEVTNPAQLRKFAGNPFFTVSGDVPSDNTVRTAAERESALLGSGSQQVVTGVAPPGPVVAPVPDQPQRSPDKVQAETVDEGLRAIHNGGGRFIIVRGDDKSSPVRGGLDKADAAAFNALADDEKAAYVAD